MGVSGLTTLLRDYNILSDDPSQKTSIPPRSTFAIDGSSFIFHVYRQAYHDHYHDVLSTYCGTLADTTANGMYDGHPSYQQAFALQTEQQDEEERLNLIAKLLPPLLPLTKLQARSESILSHLIKAQIHLQIYLDGPQRRFKQKTDEKRKQRKEQQMENWRKFCTSRVVPYTLIKRWKEDKEALSTSLHRYASIRYRYKIPNPDVFMELFPTPTLLFEQVCHTFYMAQEQYHEYFYAHRSKLDLAIYSPDIGNEKVTTLSSDDSNAMPSIKIIVCPEEADHLVAFASAKDWNNRTFSVGSDSDYVIYGYSKKERDEIVELDLNAECDCSVLYIPLETLNFVDEHTVEATVITRDQVASMFGLSQELFFEASLLMGNDYTKPFVKDVTCWKSTNFYRDVSDLKGGEACPRFLKPSVTVELFQEVVRGDDPWSDDRILDTYTVTSKDVYFSRALDFSRALYSFQDDGSLNLPDQKPTKKGQGTSHPMLLDKTVSRVDSNDLLFKIDYRKECIDALSRLAHKDALQSLHNQVLEVVANLNGDDDIVTMVHCAKKVLNNKHEANEKCEDDRMGTNMTNGAALNKWNDWESIMGIALQPTGHTTLTSVKKHLSLMDCLTWESVVTLLSFEKVIATICRIGRTNGFRTYSHHSPSCLYEPKHFLCTYRECFSDHQEKGEEETFASTSLPDMSAKHKLPIDDHREEILRSVHNHRVTIIQGETGCGKSTRVPIMLLETLCDPLKPDVKMVICQPRRIAAKSVTERIRDQAPHLRDMIALRMGHGYREYETSTTKITICTTGYLVRFLSMNPNFFRDCTHIIIDEVHERSVDTDLLCLLTRRLLHTYKEIRLILMSATVAADLYQSYFDDQSKFIHDANQQPGLCAPPIIVGSRKFKIDEYFVEDLHLRLNLSRKEIQAVHLIEEMCHQMKCQSAPNSHYMSKLHELVVSVAIRVAKHGSSVLIFVPGIADIATIIEMFETIERPGLKYHCIPLHSEIPFEEQMSIFEDTKRGEAKIVIASNVAESSLTIPDVDHVICTGLCKQIVYNEKTHRQMLQLQWISQASARQRAGRTGRVRDGNLYRLYPKDTYERYMIPHELGEILRMPLDSVLLNLREIMDGQKVSHTKVSDTLSECLEPPNLNHIERALMSLFQSKFISQPDEAFSLTSFGSLVTAMGIDLSFGAIVGFGIILGVGAEAVQVAAILSFAKSPWLIPNTMLQTPEKYNEIASSTFLSKARYDGGLYSEPFAIMNVLFDYSAAGEKERFCRENGLSITRMKRLVATVNNLRDRVASTMGMKVDRLVVNEPPRSMRREALMALRFIQGCIYDDTIICLKEPFIPQIHCDGSYSINLKGDTINEGHLRSVLDPTHHEVVLESIISMHCSGYYEPIQIRGEFPDINGESIIESILSIAIERGAHVVLIVDSAIIAYLRHEHDFEDMSHHVLDLNFVYDKTLTLFQRRGCVGRASRDTGAWRMECNLDNECSHFDKFIFKGQISEFNTLRRYICNSVGSSIAMRLWNTTKANNWPGITRFDVMTDGEDFNITLQDVADIFQTTREKVHMNMVSNEQTQKIYFYSDDVENKPVKPLFISLPQSFQLLSSIAAGYHKKPSIRFDNSKVHSTATADEVLEVYLQQSRVSDRWRQATNGRRVIVDGTSIVATAAPIAMTNELFACCPNVLELKSGMMKVEGLTLLPGKLLEVALRCIGSDTQLDSTLDEEIAELTESFRRILDATGAGRIQYSPSAVQLMHDIFDSIGMF